MEKGDLGKLFMERIDTGGTLSSIPIPSAEELVNSANEQIKNNEGHIKQLVESDGQTSLEEAPILKVGNTGEDNPSEISVNITDALAGLTPTLGGLIGYELAPLKSEWLAEADINIKVHGTLVIVASKPGEELGPNGYKVNHILGGNMSFHSKDVEQPAVIKGEALFGLVEKEVVIPQAHEDFVIEPINLGDALSNAGNLDKAMQKIPKTQTSITSKEPKTPPDLANDPAPLIEESQFSYNNDDLFDDHQDTGCASQQDEDYSDFDTYDECADITVEGGSLIDVTASLGGHVAVELEANLNVIHVITVHPDELEIFKEKLAFKGEGETLYAAELGVSIAIYNPGDALKEKAKENPEAAAELSGHFFTNINIKEVDINVTLGSDEINRFQTLASASTGEEIENIAYRPPPAALGSPDEMIAQAKVPDSPQDYAITDVTQNSLNATTESSKPNAAMEYAFNDMKKNSLEIQENICYNFNCAAKDTKAITAKLAIAPDNEVESNQTMGNQNTAPAPN